MSKKNVAVILSGCGVYDGSEIHEAVFVMESISRNNANYQCFAPDMEQMHVVNHLTGEPSSEKRNVLVESARIARSNVQDLNNLDVSKYDAIILPGGFGAAKNLSNFGVVGADMEVKEGVSSAVNAFRAAKKPIGACCIAPVILARTIPGVKVTLGQEQVSEEYPYADACKAATLMGATHEPCGATDVCVDAENRVVTTPAYMRNSPIHVVRDGISKMVEEVLKMILCV